MMEVKIAIIHVGMDWYFCFPYLEDNSLQVVSFLLFAFKNKEDY